MLRGARQAGHGQPDVLVAVADLDRALADLRGGDGDGRGRDDIHLGQQLIERSVELAPPPLSVEIVGGRYQAALVEQGANIVSIIFRRSRSRRW